MWAAALFQVLLAATGASAAGTTAQSAETELAKLVVLPLQVSSLADDSHSVLNELLAHAIRSTEQYDVLAKADIDAMLGDVEAEANCDDVACAIEIGGALGARFLVAGRVAKIGDKIIIVLKLIDTEEHKVVNSIKHKADNDEARYDEAIEESVQLLFGLKEVTGKIAETAEALALQAMLKRSDWLRYQRYRVSDGSLALQPWIDHQNRESTMLFLAELVDGVFVGLLVAILILQSPKDDDYVTPGIALGVTGAVLGGLLTLDWLNIGGVELESD